MNDTLCRIDRLSFISTHHVDVLRLDLLHPVTGGNKLFKLKYNLETAKQNSASVLTFGGPHSNHLAATALSGNEARVKTYGLVSAPAGTVSPTLDFVQQCGMQIRFISRLQMKDVRTCDEVQRIREAEPALHIIPQGGSNSEGLRGCMDILPSPLEYDFVAVACGTGTTLAGMLAGASGDTRFIGISPLKGANVLPAKISEMLAGEGMRVSIAGDEELEKPVIGQHCVLSAYAGKGFAKFEEHYNGFRSFFVERTGIMLDHVYTTKLFYGVADLCARDKLPAGSRILCVHTGGVQGNAGFEQRYAAKVGASGGYSILAPAPQRHYL